MCTYLFIIKLQPKIVSKEKGTITEQYNAKMMIAHNHSRPKASLNRIVFRENVLINMRTTIEKACHLVNHLAGIPYISHGDGTFSRPSLHDETG